MANNTETLLFVVDIQSNNARMAELAAEVRKAKQEFADLKKAVDAGTASESQLDTANVKLKNTLATTSQETRVLLAANLAQAKATMAATGSNEQLRAQLALATTAYNKLSVEERDNSEAGQALQAQAKALSDELKRTEGAVGDTRRNVGNYTAAIEPLIAQLVKLEEQQKLAAPDSAQYAQAATVIRGFQQAITDGAVKAGLSQEQLNARLAQANKAIRPAVTELVRLEEEQKKVGQGTEAFTQIGFKVGQASKKVQEATQQVAKLPTETKRVRDTVADLDQTTNVFGGRVANLKQQFTTAKQGVELAKDGFTGLKGAIAATGIGVLVLTLFALYDAFTKSDEGQENLAAGLAVLKGLFSALEGVVVTVGNALVAAAQNPQKAFSDLIDFLESRVINSFKGYGVILDGIRNGDFKQLANGIGQVATGTTNLIEKTGAYAEKLKQAAVSAAAISREKDRLEDKEIAAIALNERQRQQAERLLVTFRDRNQTEQQRIANIQQANRLEEEVLKRNLSIERDRYALILQQNAQRLRAGQLQDDERRAAEEQLAKLAQLQGEYEKQQQIGLNRISGLQAEERQKRAEAAKKAADAQAKAIEDEIRGRITATERELLAVRAGSEQELALKERLVAQKAELDAAGEKKTAAERKLIVAQSYAELLKLEDEFLQKREDAAIKARDTGDAQRAAEATAEKKRLDDAGKDREDAYKRDEAMLERYFNRRRTEVEKDYADGKNDKKTYDRQVEALDETSYGARIVLARQYGKDTSKLEADQAKAHNTNLVKTRENEKKLNDERLKEAAAFGVEIGNLVVDSLSQTGQSLQEFSSKVLILILDTLEKSAIAAIAKAAIDNAPAGPAGFVLTALETAAVTVAFESAKAALSSGSAKPFATGGIVPGVGNTDTVHTVLTPGEVVMNKAASTELAPVLSYLNSLYGGTNFAPGFNPARQVAAPTDGGLIARTLGASAGPTAAEIGREVARNVPTSIQVDTINAANNKKQRARALTTLGGG